jgi:hypothetical protein
MKNIIYYNYKLKPIDSTSPLPEDFFDGEPKPSFSELDSKDEHYKCPSVKHWHNNSWIIEMPFDLEFQYNKDKNEVFLLKNSNGFMKKLFMKHSMIYPKNIELQLGISHYFWTDLKEDIWLEMEHHPDLVNYNIRLVPGIFPISVWNRPTNFAFKIIDPDKKVFIPKGTPLYYLKFYSKNFDKKFKLVKKDMDEELEKKYKKDGFLKYFAPFKSWDIIKKRLEKKNKCPFNL